MRWKVISYIFMLILSLIFTIILILSELGIVNREADRLLLALFLYWIYRLSADLLKLRNQYKQSKKDR